MTNVKVTIDLPVNRLAALQAFLENKETAAVNNQAAAEPSETPAVSSPEPEAEAEKPTEEPITKSMIRAIGVEYTKAGRQNELIAIFNKFGANTLGQLKEEHYAEVYKALGGK